MSTVSRFSMNPFRGHGTMRVHLHGFPEGEISGATAVFVSVCELGFFPPVVNAPFIGAARMLVGNIAPHDDGTIDVLVTVEWDSDLTIGLEVLVVDD